MKVAAVQHDIVWEAPEENFRRLAPMVANAVASGARLVVLTETFATGFSMATDRIAEPDDGPSTAFLAEQAATHGVFVAGSIAVRTPEIGGRAANRLVVAGPAGILARYDKTHPFTFGHEHEHYVSGDRSCTVEIEGVRTSLFVCYDLRFAPDLWALAPRTDLYVVVANWPESRRSHWRALLVARAIENQAYVVGVNRVGMGDHLTYSGDSMIVDPMGEVCATATGIEAVLLADVEPERVRAVRTTFPFLQDRR